MTDYEVVPKQTVTVVSDRGPKGDTGLTGQTGPAGLGAPPSGYPILASNLFTRPRGLNGSSTQGWGFGGPSTGAVFTGAVDASEGPLLKVTLTTGTFTGSCALYAGGSGTVNTYRVPVTPGQVYSASIRTAFSYAGTATLNANARIRWFDNAGAQVGTSSGTNVSMTNGVYANLVCLGATAPANAAFMGVDAFYFTGTMNANDWFAATKAHVVLGSTIPFDYFDGATPGARWAGTANASTSELITPRNLRDLGA